MKKGILILVLSVLLISIFSIGSIYSADAGAGAAPATGIGGAASGTGDTGTGADTSAQINQQQWSMVPNTGNQVQFNGNGEANYNKATGETKIESKGDSEMNIRFLGPKKEDGSIGDVKSEIKGVSGSLTVNKEGNVVPGGVDLKTNGESKDIKLPTGKNEITTVPLPKDSSGNTIKDTRITGNKGEPLQVLVGKGDGGGTVRIDEAPSIKRDSDSKPDPNSPTNIVYKTNGQALEFPIGTNQFLTAQPQRDGFARVGNEIGADGKSRPYIGGKETGLFTKGNEAGMGGVEIRGNGDKTYFVGNEGIPKDAKPGNYFTVSDYNKDKSAIFQNTNKEGVSSYATFTAGEKGNSFFPEMKKGDYIHALVQAGSGVKFMSSGSSGGIIETSFIGEKNVQIKFDDNVLFKSGDDVGLYQGSSFKTDSSGNLIRSSALTTPNLKINFGDGVFKIADENGKIIANTNGEIVATQDGNTVRMAVVSEGDNSNKIVEQLRNHEIVQGEIMDPNSRVGPSRVVVNPPNAPENVKPPVEQPPLQPVQPSAQPATYVQPQPEPKENPPGWKPTIGLVQGIAANTQPHGNDAQQVATWNSMFGKELGKPYDPQVHKILALDFSAIWCGPCKAFVPTLHSAAETIGNAKFVPVDGDIHKGLAARYGVSSFPTVVYIDTGTGREVDRVKGAETVGAIQNRINRLIQAQQR